MRFESVHASQNSWIASHEICNQIKGTAGDDGLRGGCAYLKHMYNVNVTEHWTSHKMFNRLTLTNDAAPNN